MLFLEHNNNEKALPLKNCIQFSVHAVFFGFRANLRNTQYFCTNRFVCFEEQFSDIFMRASRDLSLVYCKMLILLIIINDSQTNLIFLLLKITQHFISITVIRFFLCKHFYEEKTETFCVWRKIENTFKIKNQLIGQRSNCFPRNALDFNQCKLLNA